MINIFLNGEAIILEKHCTLGDFLKIQSKISGNYAVALNKKFIARADYEHTVLNNQDHITIIRPMQGG
ncbi:MAG TPA: sulfur carrier protein ThiS [Gammaproteobacteria bacterium]|nr:sulfur carrier protein ThiS [Gammaproteobacteria bacterium]